MAVTVTILNPLPGTSVPPTVVAPAFHMSGNYTVDNIPLDKIVCRVVYPPASGVNPLVWEQNADHAAAGKWDVTFAALPQGLDACMQAEIFVQGVVARQDFDTVEDIDVLASPIIGTISAPTLLPVPMPPIP